MAEMFNRYKKEEICSLTCGGIDIVSQFNLLHTQFINIVAFIYLFEKFYIFALCLIA